MVHLPGAQEGRLKGAFFYIFAGRLSHFPKDQGIVQHALQGCQQAFGIIARNHQAGDAGYHVFTGPPFVAYHHRQARRLGFQHHVAEGVGGAGEDEQIRRGIHLRQLFTR